MARTRNLSPWAYWRLRLDTTEPVDPLPINRLDTTFDAWRGRTLSRLRSALGPAPRPVPLDFEVLSSEDTPAGYRREKVVFDSENTLW